MLNRFSALASLLVLSMTSMVVGQEACKPCFYDRDEFITEPTFVPFANASRPCTDVLVDMEALAANGVDGNSTQCLNAQLEAFQLGCCARPPQEYCSICPDGTPHEKQNIIPTGETNELSCEVSQFRTSQLNGLFKTGDCSDTVLRRGAFYCGCPNTEQQCYICPDGGEVGNARRADAYQAMGNCGGQAYFFSLFTANECEGVRPNLGVDYAAFCQCEGYEMPENEFPCDLCPEGYYVKDPSKIHTEPDAQFERTCQQALDFTEYITIPATCENNMQQAREACCVPSGATGMFAGFSLMLTVGVVLVQSLF